MLAYQNLSANGDYILVSTEEKTKELVGALLPLGRRVDRKVRTSGRSKYSELPADARVACPSKSNGFHELTNERSLLIGLGHMARY